MTLLACAALAACDIPAAVFDGGTTTSTGGTSTDGGSAGQTTATHPTGGSGGRTGTGGSSTGGSTTGGSTTGGTGGTTTTTTTTTTTVTGPTVTCNFPSYSECMPGLVCCYEINGSTDSCGMPGSCDPPADFIEIKCDENSDCPAGKECCAYYTGDISGSFNLEKTYCDTSCDLVNQETPACQDILDCLPGFDCLPLIQNVYPGWLFCLTP